MIENVYIMPHPPIIVPDIGRGNEAEAAETIGGCQTVAAKIRELEPETIIIITPHGPVFQNALCIGAGERLSGDFGRFGHRGISFEFQNDTELLSKIAGRLNKHGIGVVVNDTEARKNYGIDSDVDHGALVPLYFITREYSDFKLVHITYGMLDAPGLYACGMAINEAVGETGRNAVLVASSDLSHRLKDDGPYRFDPNGPVYDEFVVKCFKDKDFAGFMDADSVIRECAGECGHRSMNIAIGVFEGRDTETEVLSYEGPFGVGYMTASIKGMGPGESVLAVYRRSRESEYVRLARNTIEKYILTGETKVPGKRGLDKKGTFVSIKKHGRLRGCIGTIGPTTDSIEDEIIDNAIKAAVGDPRFDPITADELDDLDISVDVLFPPEPIDSRDMLDVREYGVIVSKGFRRGLLLPNLEGVNSIDEQINIALEKAGISPDENYSMERFRVVRHK